MQRDFAKLGLGYTMTLPDIATELTIRYVRRTRGETHGELTVTCGLPFTKSSDGHLHQANLNISGSEARTRLAKTLAGRANLGDAIDWIDVLEDFCRRVLAAEREGEPIEKVGTLPMAMGGETYRLDPILPLGEATILYGDSGTGKALALNTPIATPIGWSTMGELAVGDFVYDDRGLPTQVVAATKILEARPCYRVVFSDGSTIVADAEHLWRSETLAYRHRPHQRAYKVRRRTVVLRRRRSGPHEPELVTTRQMADSLVVSGERNHAIRLAEPLLGNERELPVEPYALGAWLGDGTSASAAITSADPAIVAAIAAGGTPIRGTTVQRGAARLYRLTRGHGDRDSVQHRLRELGVLGNKHIPRLYLRASFTQRLALLQGLMDTDGYVDRHGSVSFTTTSLALADGVHELVASLGMRPSVSEGVAAIGGRVISAKWDVSFAPQHPVFRLPRKASRVRPPGDRGRRRYVVAVDPVASVPVRCIQVAADSGMFLAGRAMIPTHNSTLAAAIAVSVQSGVSFIEGWIPRKGPVLYLDWEAGRASLNKRVRGVAMGGNVPGASSIDYRNCRRSGPLHTFAESLASIVDKEGYGLVVVDSVGMAAGIGGEGGDANESTLRLFTAIGFLGTTVLAVDHVAKAATEDERAKTRPYGSIYKSALARATWELRLTNNDRGSFIGLYNTKANDAPLLAPISLQVFHDADGAIRYERLAQLPVELTRHLSQRDQIVAALRQVGHLTTEEIAAETGLADNKVRAVLSRHGDLFSKLPSGKWEVLGRAS